MILYSSRVLIIACTLLIHSSVLAEGYFGIVTINGSEIPSFYFDIAHGRYEKDANEAKRVQPDIFGENVMECEQEIKQYTFETVVSHFLFLERGRIEHPKEVLRLSKYSVFSEHYEGDEEAPEEGSQEYTIRKTGELYSDGSMLEDRLLENVRHEDVEKRYKEMLESKHSLVVNESVYKLNSLIFRTREEAENAKKRLVAGESYKALAIEFKQTNHYVALAADKWQTYGHPLDYEKYKDSPRPQLKKGEIFGPVVMLGGMSPTDFGYIGWRIFQVIDKRVVPVVGMEDVYSAYFEKTRHTIKMWLEHERKVTLRQQLWGNATITLDGESVPSHSGRVEFMTCLSTN